MGIRGVFAGLLFLLASCTQNYNCPPCSTTSSPAPTSPTNPLPTPTTLPTSVPSPLPANSALPFFVIGVDSPSEDLVFACPKPNEITLDKMTQDQLFGCQMLKWKLRGVNTAVRVPQTHDAQKWEFNAKVNGLMSIREPSSDIAADGENPNLLAFEQGDEPDLHHVPAGDLTAQYAKLKKLAPKKLVFLNISGGEYLGANQKTHPYANYFAAADLLASDLYPVTGWGRPDWVDGAMSLLVPWWNPGILADALFEVAPQLPQLAYIETSNQLLPWVDPKVERGVTPDEFRGEIWDAIIHGVSGIIYFPEVIGVWSFDGTPPDVALEMVKQNQLLTKLSPILLSPGKRLTNEKMPFEAAERISNGKTYRLVLNLSHEAHDYAGPSVSTPSHFAPFEVKLYQDGKPFQP